MSDSPFEPGSFAGSAPSSSGLSPSKKARYRRARRARIRRAAGDEQRREVSWAQADAWCVRNRAVIEYRKVGAEDRVLVRTTHNRSIPLAAERKTLKAAVAELMRLEDPALIARAKGRSA